MPVLNRPCGIFLNPSCVRSVLIVGNLSRTPFTEKRNKDGLSGIKRHRWMSTSRGDTDECSKDALRPWSIAYGHHHGARSACRRLESDDPVHVQPARPDSGASPTSGDVSVS